MRRAATASALLLLAGCSEAPPRLGQYVVHFTTDAVLPASATSQDLPPLDQPQPLFDRLLVDVLSPPGKPACNGCSREIAIDRERMDAGEISVGVAPEVGVGGYLVRARLVLAANRVESDPDPGETIDTTVSLPSLATGDLREVTVELLTDTVGSPTGTPSAPSAPRPGSPAPGLVGTWAGAQRVACKDPPPSGQVCVLGGAFWMAERSNLTSDSTAVRHRLVVLSPFYLDAREVTVGAFRSAKGLAGTISNSALSALCTLTPDPGDQEGLPMNCIDWLAADTLCQSLGAELPTEAQLAYVEGGLRSTHYPWGDAAPGCGDAVFGRSPLGGIGTHECRPAGAADLPLPSVRSDYGRDTLTLPTGTIYDLAGNLAEWSRDKWNRDAEPCWSAATIYKDPSCAHPSPADGERRAAMGGDWYSGSTNLAAGTRTMGPAVGATFGNVGLRCARPAQPE